VILAAWCALAVGGLVQTTAGFGFALVCSPVLVAALGPTAAVRSVITLSSLVSQLILVRTWRYTRLREALVLAVPAVVLAAPVAVLVHHLNSRLLTMAAGVVTVSGAALMARGNLRLPLHGPGGVLAVGTASALMNALGGLSGPAGAIYAANEEWPPEAIAPTLQVFGLVLNAASLATLGGPELDYRLASALPVGWVCGIWVAGRLSASQLHRVVLALAAAGGAAALMRGAIG
jgi:uncharacterized membrane protein YfcA